jgi:hypothetical protein
MSNRVSQGAGVAPVEQLEGRTLFSTYIVNGLGDGAGSVKQVFPGLYSAPTLRAAITAAHAKADADVITLNPLLSGTITLSAALGELQITNDVSIQGFGANRQAINGGGTGRVFNIAAGADVEISDVTISNAKNQFTGGAGIRNLGNLTLSSVQITNNILSDADGAGVYNAGSIKVYNSTFAGNVTNAGGGGLFNSGSAVIANSTFFGNKADFGGGIYNASGKSMLISNCTISGNTAVTSGGGISGTVDDPDTMTPTTLMNNMIVAGNVCLFQNGGQGPDLYGFFPFASSNNIIGELGFAKGMDPLKNQLGGVEYATPVIDAKLAPLGYHGGTTQTMPLLAGSPALDKGKNSLVISSTDQRGGSRIQHGIVDVGATEGTRSPSIFAGLTLLISDLFRSFR